MTDISLHHTKTRMKTWQPSIKENFWSSLLSSTFEFAFSFWAILTHFVIFLFIAHFLFWVKIGDQGACAGVYWIWGAQYVKISPEITQFCNFSISNLRFNLLKRENIQKHCFQSNLAESLKIAGNIFSCSPPSAQAKSGNRANWLQFVRERLFKWCQMLETHSQNCCINTLSH